MKLKTDPNVIYRIPQFSFKASLKDNWDALKQSIADSSPEFHRLIKEMSYEELQQKDHSYIHTVWKYFNRTRYRATPYGSFAGLGTARLTNSPFTKLIISSEQKLHRFPDWTCKEQVDVSFTEMAQKNVKLLANSTYYFAGDQLRYVCFFDGLYELAELPADELQLKILKRCRQATSISDIGKLFADEADVLLLLESMYNDQLLLSEFAPNIIGQEYFERINFTGTAPSTDYIIAERQRASGAIDQTVFRHLPALVERLHNTLPSYEAPELIQFINGFRKRFREEEVPLMVALDPELGLSYGGLDNDHLSSELIRQLTGSKKAVKDIQQESTLRLLLPQFAAQCKSVIDLEQVAIPELPNNHPLPNSLPVICSESDGILQIEHIGGATANSLTARFTLAMEDVHSICHTNAIREQEANPEVVFFDIGYMTGNRVDNVNRRKAVYNYQLHILNYAEGDDLLTFEDILVSVKGDELYLRSSRLNKRVVPRLSTAYNYLLSDLPAFRLLCDLQHQGIHKNLYLRLIDRIPGLSYYPRVQFRNIILSPATWRISFKDLSGQKKEEDFTGLLNQFFAENDIEGFIRVAKGDQTLCIDTKNEDDLQQLWTMLSRNKVLHLEETLLPTDSKIIDENGAPYIGQYMLSLYHDQELYKNSPALAESASITAVEEKIIPGRAWLYYEIYCHRIRADEILTGELDRLLKTHAALIKNWFFIRYSENGNHVRLRIRLNDMAYAQPIMSDLANLLENKLRSGIITDVLLRTYNRETGRYGSKNIEQVEQHFELDSNYVLALLKLNTNDTHKYLLCCKLISEIQSANVLDPETFTGLLKINLKHFEQEHGFDSKDYKQLNAAHQIFENKKTPSLNQPEAFFFTSFIQSFINTLQQYPSLERQSIFTALFHMHVNRLFPDRQRIHEAVIYYFMDKDYRKNSYPVTTRIRERD